MRAAGFIDLHCHTTFSDGSFSPEEVVRLATDAGVSTLAITDHDDVACWDRASAAADAAGLRLLPGVELSAMHRNTEVHILGYGFDPAHPGLLTALEEFRDGRRRRAERMIDVLQGSGFTLTVEDVVPNGYMGAIGRPHVARYLVASGQVDTVQHCFDRYLATGKPAFFKKVFLEMPRACALIRDAGGVPVVAHPKFFQAEQWLGELVNMGLGGIEVWHSAHTEGDRAKYLKYAERLGLVKTGGSDFHGDAKPDVYFGGVRTPAALLEALETAIVAAQEAAGTAARRT